MAQAEAHEGRTRSRGFAGIQIRDLTEDDQKTARVKAGVVVDDVEDGSAADDAGIRPDDVIEEVGGKPVASVSSFSRAIRESRRARNTSSCS